MDELTEQAENEGGWLSVLGRCYGPLMLLLFDWTGAVITLMSFLFTVGWLRRTGELTATLSAGISHGRIFRSMIIASAGIILIQLANREFLLPVYRNALSIKAADMGEDAEQPVTQNFDKVNQILIGGRSLLVRKNLINNPQFELYGDFPGFGASLEGETAVWLPEDETHPAGFLVRNVQRPESIQSIASVGFQGRPILLTARDQAWLRPDECFVVTLVNTDLLQNNPTSKRQASIVEMVRLIRNPSIHSSDADRVLLHERIVRVPVDMALVLMVLPLVVNRKQKNLFVCIGAAIGIVVFFFAMKTVAGGMASSGYVLTPTIAAWVPFLVIGPLAFVRYRQVQLV